MDPTEEESGPEEPKKKLYTFEDEILEEVEVSEDQPPEDDESTVWTDDGDDVEETAEDVDQSPVVDLSVFTFTGHSDSVYCAAVNPSQRGVMITGGGDDRAFIWRYEPSMVTQPPEGEMSSSEPQTVFELAGHTDTVVAVGFNFDGTLALTGSYDGSVKVWRVADGELLLTLDGPEDVEFAEWHPKGNAIIAGSKDGTAWMWLAHNGQCVQVFAGHDGGVSCGCFTKDGKAVCTGGEDGTVRIWAPKTGASRHVFEGHFGHGGSVTSLVSSSDGDMLLSGSVDGKVLLLQVSGKRVLQTFVHSQPKSLASDGAPMPQPPTAGHVSGVHHHEEDEGDAEAEAAEASFGRFKGAHLSEENDVDEEGEGSTSVECVGFSSAELRWAASGGMDNTLKVWDIVSGSCRCVCSHGDSVVALQWHSSQPIISTAALDNNVRVWDARSGSLLALLSGHKSLVTSLTMATLPSAEVTGSDVVDVIVSVSDDKTAKVFHPKQYYRVDA